MSAQKIQQADFTFAVPNPDLTNLASIQEMVARATKSESFAQLVQHLNAEAMHHPVPTPPSPLAKAKGFDVTISATGGSSGGKPVATVTVGATIHF